MVWSGEGEPLREIADVIMQAFAAGAGGAHVAGFAMCAVGDNRFHISDRGDHKPARGNASHGAGFLPWVFCPQPHGMEGMPWLPNPVRLAFSCDGCGRRGVQRLAM